MLSIYGLILRLLEGIAIVVAIYLITKKQMNTKETLMLVITIAGTFLLLDLFSPGVASGARQGTGFGLGYQQLAGDGSMPLRYYKDVVEGMDDPEAVKYYKKYNPSVASHVKDTPSIILQEYMNSPYATDKA